MKLTIDPRELRAALTIARRIIPCRSTLPILTHVLLTVGDGSVTVEAANLEARCCRTVPAITAEPGAVCLPARALFDVLAVFKREVSLETDGKTVRITGDGAELTMQTIAAEEFPAAPDLGAADGSLSINEKTLRSIVEGAIRSAAPNDMRPVLAGIQLSAGDGGLTVAAADGFRMRVESVQAWPGNLSALVPWRGLREIVRSLKPDEVVSLETFTGTWQKNVGRLHTMIGTEQAKTETITKTYVGRALKVSTPAGFWTARLIDGTFPNFQRIIPKPDTIVSRVTLATDDLRRVVRLALTLGDYGSYLRFSVSEGAFSVAVRDVESISGTFTLPAGVRGNAVKFAMHPRFLRDALAEAGKRVTLEIVGPQSPVTVKPAGEGSVRHYVMPAHVEW